MTDRSRTVVIVGGVAGGASAATRARRMNEQAEIVLFEKDRYVSFANCGLPYYIGGEIQDRSHLLVATPEFLARRYRIDVRTRQEVTGIDRARRVVKVVRRDRDESYEQRYDRLILAPGASPIAPSIEGVEARGVQTLRNLEDTDRICEAADTSRMRRAVVVGGGYIGLEMVEQLVRRGFRVSLAELQPQIAPQFDPEMIQPVEDELRRHGVQLILGDGMKRVLVDAEGRAAGVELASGTQLDGDLVILGLGVRPNLELARSAGLQIGPSGGIATNEYMQTSDPDIYAVGDAAEYHFGPTGMPMRIALAGPANRAGRIAGEHAATGAARPMAPVFGTSIVRVFGQVAALTGLSSQLARRFQVPASSVTVVGGHHAGYYPGASAITIKLLFAPDTGRILGAQAVGAEGVDKRIDVVATAMAFGATVADLAGVDLAYAPPFGAAKDPLHMAAFAATNAWDGLDEFLDADVDLAGKQVIDVRTEGEVAVRPLPGAEKAVVIPVDELRERMDELDPGLPTVVSCGVGMRAHLAARILKQHGFQDVRNLSGGATLRRRAWPPRNR